MNYEEQRRLGAKLAEAAKLPKTHAAIKNDKICFEDILKTAMAEGGLDTLVSNVLSGPPEWSFRTLRYVSALGTRRDELVKKVAEVPHLNLDGSDFALTHGLRSVRNLQALASTFPKPTDPIAANISGMTLFDDAGFDCMWTLLWFNNGYQPNTKYADWNTWKWSDSLSLGKSSGTVLLKDFAANLPNAPLVAGNQVWMYVYVNGGNDLPYLSQPCLSFIYDPNTPNVASFTVSGTTTIGNLGYNGILR